MMIPEEGCDPWLPTAAPAGSAVESHRESTEDSTCSMTLPLSRRSSTAERFRRCTQVSQAEIPGHPRLRLRAQRRKSYQERSEDTPEEERAQERDQSNNEEKQMVEDAEDDDL